MCHSGCHKPKQLDYFLLLSRHNCVGCQKSPVRPVRDQDKTLKRWTKNNLEDDNANSPLQIKKIASRLLAQVPFSSVWHCCHRCDACGPAEEAGLRRRFSSAWKSRSFQNRAINLHFLRLLRRSVGHQFPCERKKGQLQQGQLTPSSLRGRRRKDPIRGEKSSDDQRAGRGPSHRRVKRGPDCNFSSLHRSLFSGAPHQSDWLTAASHSDVQANAADSVCQWFVEQTRRFIKNRNDYCQPAIYFLAEWKHI